jgi:uncharacterized protein YutD
VADWGHRNTTAVHQWPEIYSDMFNKFPQNERYSDMLNKFPQNERYSDMLNKFPQKFNSSSSMA